jgi:hypothetical protein
LSNAVARGGGGARRHPGHGDQQGRGSVFVSGNEVTVTLNFDQPTPLLRIIGIDSVNVQGRAQATSVRGIDIEETAP